MLLYPGADLYPQLSLLPGEQGSPGPSVGTVGGVRLVTADDICLAIEAVLREYLPAWAHAAGLAASPLSTAKGQVRTWDQVPEADAIARAVLPAGAIASPGLTTSAAPTRRGGVLRWDATWRVAVAVYDRGGNFGETQSRCRRWAALVPTVVLAHPRLGGLAESITWVDTQTTPSGNPTAARTFSQAVVVFDVTAHDVLPLGAAPPAPDGAVPTRPTVTKSTVSVVGAVTTRPQLPH